MGIDIYFFESSCSSKEEDYIFTIDDILFSQLEGFIEFYKEKTGKMIDPYGDLKLDRGGILQFQEFIKLYLKKNPNDDKLMIFVKIKDMLDVAIQKDKSIMFYGD